METYQQERVPSTKGKRQEQESVASIIRNQLRPHFEELSQCNSTQELLASKTYQQIRPAAEKVLNTIDTGNFAHDQLTTRSRYCILAWNLERGIEYEGQLAEFRSHPYLQAADVFLLTETDNGMARSGNRNIARALASELGLNYAFAPCYLNLAKGAGIESEMKGQNDLALHGNAILSRYPISNPRLIPIGNGRDKMSGREKRLGQQTAIACEIGLPNYELTVCSVHLDAQSKQKHRRDQMAGVIDGLPSSGPAVIGGDWNTTTFDSSGALPAIMGYWLRVFLGAGNVIRNHFLRPYTWFEKELFDLVEHRGFDWRSANVLDEHTTSYDSQDLKTYKNLREWVPGWCFDFIKWALRDYDGKCPLKIDWFAVREAVIADPIVLHEFREGREPILSDHDAIGIEVVVG